MSMGGASSKTASIDDTTIHVAAGRGNLAAVRHFVEKKGIDVNSRVSAAIEWTPLHLACRANRVEVVRYLVSKGADVNTVAYSKTPLTGACYRGFVDLATILLECGADVKYETPARETALTIALSQRRTHVLRAILTHCRSTDADFGSLLLRVKHMDKTLFQCADTAEIAQVMVEQPRQEGKLLSVCHELLTAKNADGLTRLEEIQESFQKMDTTWFGLRVVLRLDGMINYLSSFEDLPLAVPEAISVFSADSKRRKLHGRIAVKPNPGLNEFQRSIVEETLKLVLQTTTVPENVAYGILGYLSPLDVMKRSPAAPSPVAPAGGFQQFLQKRFGRS